MSIRYAGDIKVVCWHLEALAEQFKGWTLEKYLKFMELQTIQGKQFDKMFKEEQR